MRKWLNTSGSHKMAGHGFADNRDGWNYCFDPGGDIELAVNVALATDRPLLVRGKAGQGKSSLAQAIAVRLEWRYVEYVVTARSAPDDLLWRVDSVRRLADAQLGGRLKDFPHYVQPGPFWWAMDPAGARRRGVCTDALAKPPGSGWPPADDEKPAVLLIDEIDKADPDLPNALLVPLGSYSFEVPEVGRVAMDDHSTKPLVIITSNDERVLPEAFERRCILLELKDANRERLRAIAIARCPEISLDLIETIITRSMAMENSVVISPAEIIDAVLAWDKLRHVHSDLTADRVLGHVLSRRLVER